MSKTTETTETEETTAKVELSPAAKLLAEVAAVVVPLAKAGKGEDEIVPAILTQTSVTKVRAAIRLMKSCLEGVGLAMSNKERNAKVAALMAKLPKPTDWAAVAKIRDTIVGSLEDTDAAQALRAMKAFAKTHETELPTKPKSEPGESGARGFRGEAFAWMVANAGADRKKLAEFITASGKSASDVQRLCTIYDMALDVARKLGGTVPDAGPVEEATE